MRTLLAILFVALLAAAPLAIAERGSDKARAHDAEDEVEVESDENETESDDDANSTRQHRAREGRGDHSSDDDESDDGHANKTRADRDARRAEAEGLRANRSAVIESFLERLHAYRASWLENATSIREACKAQTVDENATQEERTSAAHCIRDGYAEWRAERRAELKELRLELRALFEGGRGRGSSG